MTRRDYEDAARIVQDAYTMSSSEDPDSIRDAFIRFFRYDKNNRSRFDEDRFRRACVPGANVRARG